MSFGALVTLLYILHCTSYSSIHSRGITIFGLKKQTFALWELYFRFRIWWHYCSLQKARIYQQTKFHSYNSIHGWDITISGLEKETTAILKFYFRFRFRLSPSACHSAPVYQISSRSDRPRQRNDVMLFSWWRISAILRNGYVGIFQQWVLRFGRNSVAYMRITANWSTSKPEVEFQYGGRLYFENGNSYISVANWGISTKFGLLIDFDLLKAVTSTNTKLEVVFSGRGRHFQK